MLRQTDTKTKAASSTEPTARLFKPAFQGYERSEETQRSVDSDFERHARTTTQRDCYYTLTGDKDYSFLLSHRICLDVSAIAKAKIEAAPPQTPLSFLDIGAGGYQLSDALKKQYGDKINAYGISASDIFRVGEKKIDEFHVVGNAENLSQVFVNESFDLMASRATFIHFTDTIGSLKQAYAKLKPGGILLIDNLHIPGCESHLENIVAWLKNKGYLVLAECSTASIKPFIIQKPVDGRLNELVFPVLYSGIDKVVEYKPHPDVFNSPKNNYDDRSEVKSLFEKAAKISPSLFENCNDLPSLFSNPAYQKLTPSDQFTLILAINLQNEEQYNASLKEVIAMGEKNALFTEKVVGPIQQGGGNFIYELNDLSLKLSPEEKLACIVVAAMREFHLQTQINQIIKQLSQLGIPYNKNFLTYSLPFNPEKDCLQFPDVANLANTQHCGFSKTA